MAVLGRPTTSARRPYFFFLEPEAKKTLRFRRRGGRRWRRSASAINALADVGHLPWLKEYEGRASLSKPGSRRTFFYIPGRAVCAGDGIRTRTPLSRQRILSPRRLPFRHPGERLHSNLEAAQTGVAVNRGSRYPHVSSFDGDVTLREGANHGGQQAVFFTQDPVTQTVFGVAGQHRDCGLRDDRPGVRAFVHEMNGAAGDLRTVVDGLLLSVRPWEGGQQGRVN